MTETKPRTTVQAETNPSNAAGVNARTETSQMKAARVNATEHVHGNAECRDALMRCYNR